MAKTDWDKYYQGLKRESKTKAELEKAGWAIEIAMQIAQLRKDKGLTQRQLANLINVPQPGIARLERIDYKGYSLKTLEKIAKALDTTIKISFVPKDQSDKIYTPSRVSFRSSLGTVVEAWDQAVIKLDIDDSPTESLRQVKADFSLLKTQEKTFNFKGLIF